MRKPNQRRPLRHRFRAEVDIATAFDTFAQLFPAAAPPSGLSAA